MMAVSRSCGTTSARARRKREPPTPPHSTTIIRLPAAVFDESRSRDGDGFGAWFAWRRDRRGRAQLVVFGALPEPQSPCRDDGADRREHQEERAQAEMIGDEATRRLEHRREQ